jgi:hypothetical protein
MSTMRILGTTTLTSKNQVSIPAAGVREIGLESGDRFLVGLLDDEMIVLLRDPESWTDAFAGKLTHLFGDHEETLRFLDEERAGWENDENGG